MNRRKISSFNNIGINEININNDVITGIFNNDNNNISLLDFYKKFNKSDIKTLDYPIAIAVESSIISTTGSYSLTDPNIERSKLHIMDGLTGKELFSWDPTEIPDFKNANEIKIIDNDIFIVYYWNNFEPNVTSRIACIRNVSFDLENKEVYYEDIEYIDTNIRMIHGMYADNTHIWLSSRSVKTIGQLAIKSDLSTFQSWNNSNIPEPSGGTSMDDIVSDEDYVYIHSIDIVSNQSRSTVRRLKKTDMEGDVDTVISFEPYPTQSTPSFLRIYGDYLYFPKQDSALSENVELYRVNINNFYDFQVLPITLPNPGDLRAIVEANGSIWITTGRNPYLIQVDRRDFKTIGITELTEAQVPNIPNGFYESLETGYITDDIAALGDYLYLGVEVAKQGVLVVNIHDLNNRYFYGTDWNYDCFGVAVRKKTASKSNSLSDLSNVVRVDDNISLLTNDSGYITGISNITDIPNRDYTDLQNLPTLYEKFTIEINGLNPLDIENEDTINLIGGNNVTISRVGNDITFEATVTGGGGINDIFGGTGISIDKTDPNNPIINGFDGEYASLSGLPNLSDFISVGDNISELTNDSGFITGVSNITEIPNRSYNDLQDLPSLYTSTDFDIDFGNKTTDDLTEGSINKYLTGDEINIGDNISLLTNDSGYITGVSNITEIPNRSYNDLQDLPSLYTSTNFDIDFGNKTTDGLTEGSINKYLTGDEINIGDNISLLTNDSGFITGISNITEIPNRSYNDLQDLPDLSDFISVGDNISELTNDVGYITGITNITEIPNRSYNDLQNLPTLYEKFTIEINGLNPLDIENEETINLIGGNNVTISRVGNDITFDATGGATIDLDTLPNASGNILTNDNGTLSQRTVTELYNEDINPFRVRTGTEINFDFDVQHGTVSSPVSGNITLASSGNLDGRTALIIHNSSIAPSFPNEFIVSTESKPYKANDNNFIYCQYLDGQVFYTITNDLQIATNLSTSGFLTFQRDTIVGSRNNTISGSISIFLGNAVQGVSMLIIHESATNPIPGTAIKLNGSFDYEVNEINYIYMQYIGNNVFYTITQED